MVRREDPDGGELRGPRQRDPRRLPDQAGQARDLTEGAGRREPQLSGKEYKIFASIEEGISQDNAKKVAKIIRDEGPKGVKAQVQGEELRVSSKSRDDLQAVQALLKGQDFDFALQFVNYR